MPKLTDAQRTALCGDILSGDRYKDIAARYGVNVNTVTHHAKRLGYGPANRGKQAPATPTPGTVHRHDPDAPLTLRGTPPWMLTSACRGTTEPEAFYPKYENETDVAKALCRRCPVRETCLDWALRNDEAHGVWGGLSERERRRLAANTTTSTSPIGEEATAC